MAVSTARWQQEDGKEAATNQSPQDVREAARTARWCMEGNHIKMEARKKVQGSKCKAANMT